MATRFTLEGNVSALKSLDKQIVFGVALGITRFCQDASADAKKATEEQFTIRNNWLNTRKFGINANIARAADFNPTTGAGIKGSVGSDAWWMEQHETAATRRWRGIEKKSPGLLDQKTGAALLGIPFKSFRGTKRAGGANIYKRLTSTLRPSRLIQGYNKKTGTFDPAVARRTRAFVVRRKDGTAIIFQRTGKGKSSEIKPLYYLTPTYKITRNSTIIDPVLSAWVSRGVSTIVNNIQFALDTAK